jgi:hypothetical protein
MAPLIIAVTVRDETHQRNLQRRPPAAIFTAQRRRRLRRGLFSISAVMCGIVHTDARPTHLSTTRERVWGKYSGEIRYHLVCTRFPYTTLFKGNKSSTCILNLEANCHLFQGV